MGVYRRFCVQCGGELKQSARFCAKCGRPAAANSPQPAVTGEHDVGPRDLQAPPPSPAWDASAVPPDGALFPPPRPGYSPQDAPFHPEGSRLPPEGSRLQGSRLQGSRLPPEGSRLQGSRLPPEGSRLQGSRLPPEGHGRPQEGQGYPPEGPSFPPEGHGSPPEGPPFPRDDTAEDLAFPRDDPIFPRDAAAYGSPFPRDDTAATQTMPASLSKGLALPSAYPAAAAALPAALAFSGPPAAAGSADPAPAPSDTAQFSQNWVNEVGFSPQWEPSPPSASDVEEADRDRPRPGLLLLAGLIALVAAVIVVPALLIAHSLHGIMGGGSAAAQPTAKQPPRGATATAPSQLTAAGGLATLLAQTAADRISIVNAVGAVEDCTATLARAPQVFQTAAASRQRLLQQLAGLPGRSALPALMLQELTGAWQASAAVDQDLGRWAQDEVARGCKPDDHADANFQASEAPDVQATNDKTAFVAMWNAIAVKYGLTRYQTSQL